MKKRVDLTEQDINDYIAGTTLQEIASRYFVSRHTITRKMRETGREDVRALIKERAVNGACKLSESQIADAIQRVKNGEPVRDIAEEFGVVPDTIRFHIRRNGVKAARAERRPRVIKNSGPLVIPDTPVTRALKLMRSFAA